MAALARGARIDEARRQTSRHRHRGRRLRLLLPGTISRKSRRIAATMTRVPAFFSKLMDECAPAHAADRAPSAARHRRGSTPSPARPDASWWQAATSPSRPSRRNSHTRRQYRTLLLDADGGAVAQCARKHAMEMLLTGDAIDAHEAARIGLVNRVVANAASARHCRRTRPEDRFEIASNGEDRQSTPSTARPRCSSMTPMPMLRG